MYLLNDFVDKLMGKLGLPIPKTSAERAANPRMYPGNRTVGYYRRKAAKGKRESKHGHVAVAAFVHVQPQSDRWFLRLEDRSKGEDFALIGQTSDQRQMMFKYGQVIVGMDATYKTTQW